MTNVDLRRAFARFVALSGVAINGLYSIERVGTLANPGTAESVRQIAISAFALEVGWAALLLWVALKPIERRSILLFTTIPILLGNAVHSVNQLSEPVGGAIAFAVNMGFGLLYAGLYAAAYLAGVSRTTTATPETR